jgi:ribosome production factor 2
MRPLFHFSGPQFAEPTDPSTSMLAGAEPTQHDPTGAYQHFKSFVLDFFRGEELKSNQIALAGLQHVICVTAAPRPDDNQNGSTRKSSTEDALADLYKAAGLSANGAMMSSATSTTVTAPAGTLIHFRVYTVQMLASGSKVPRIELQESGPSFDFELRRRRPASIDMFNQALKRPKTEHEKNRQGKDGNKKNIQTDDMGDTVGRIHVGKQDLSSLQTRKMKGLKKQLDPAASSDNDDDDLYPDHDGSDDDSELEMEDLTMPNGDDEVDDDDEEDDDEEDDDEEDDEEEEDDEHESEQDQKPRKRSRS